MSRGPWGTRSVTSGRREEAEAFVQRVRTRVVDAVRRTLCVCLLINAARGDMDRAFSWLEKAFQVTSSWIALFLKSDPRMDVLRTDPRCSDLLRRMKLN